MLQIECEQCGGTDFYKEAGYYYCSGCQLQSQEVQEYAFDEFDAVGGTGGRVQSKKVQSEKSDPADNKITSWECYNHILLGLTNELINLGANAKLKETVRILWLMYLEKLEVFKRGRNDLPKLQAVTNEIDAQIIYGKLKKLKRKRSNKSSSDETNATTLDSSSIKRDRIRKKRALAQYQYEEFSQKSQGTPSLHNETLTSLQSSEKSSRCTTPVSFNVYATKELRKKQSAYHLKKHRLDSGHTMSCHKVGYRTVSHKYRCSPYILSLNKLYALLYLALLITRDKIQLSDMLRFIQEGHLSFNTYSHLLPEDYTDKVLNFRNFKKNSSFATSCLRNITSEMANFLQVEWYITCPNLVELCERYCRELNLPKEICDCAKNILSRSNPKLSFKRRECKVPNYEGRVLSIILFVIKLLFGLDGVTEFHLGNYAEILNQSEAVSPKMFNVVDWMKYIEYRDIVVANNHFPSNFDKGDVKNINLAVGFLARRQYSEVKLNKEEDKCKQLLDKIKDNLIEPEITDFPVSLTPFLDYAKLLQNDYLTILSKDFTSDSLIYILRPYKFLKAANKGFSPDIVHGGANENWVLEKLRCAEQERRQLLKKRNEAVTVELTFDKLKDEFFEETEVNEPNNEEVVDLFQHNYEVVNEKAFKKNSKRLKKHLKDIKDYDLRKVKGDLDLIDEDYSTHYNPYERFWIMAQLRLERLSYKDSKDFFKKFPYTFRLVLKECQRIAQQSEQDFLAEYQFTELYLSYYTDYNMEKKNKQIDEKLLQKFLENSVHFW